MSQTIYCVDALRLQGKRGEQRTDVLARLSRINVPQCVADPILSLPEVDFCAPRAVVLDPTADLAIAFLDRVVAQHVSGNIQALLGYGVRGRLEASAERLTKILKKAAVFVIEHRRRGYSDILQICAAVGLQFAVG